MKKRKIIILDEIPDSFFKKPKICHVEKPKPIPTIYERFTCDDNSGTLIVEKWRTIWYYRNYHVRVTSSSNHEFPEGTTFKSAECASNMLYGGGHHRIHKAIKNDKEINNCWLEYTMTKLKN